MISGALQCHVHVSFVISHSCHHYLSLSSQFPPPPPHTCFLFPSLPLLPLPVPPPPFPLTLSLYLSLPLSISPLSLSLFSLPLSLSLSPFLSSLSPSLSFSLRLSLSPTPPLPLPLPLPTLHTEADIISTVEFNHDGEFLATGDKGGRVVIFQRDGTKMRVGRVHSVCKLLRNVCFLTQCFPNGGRECFHVYH